MFGETLNATSTATKPDLEATPHLALKPSTCRQLNHHQHLPPLHLHISRSKVTNTFTMASFLASIFGTELDKVNCSFYFVSILPIRLPSGKRRRARRKAPANSGSPENRRLPPWRPLLAQARQALVQPDHPHAQPLPEPSLRQQEPHEPLPAAEPLRRLLRGHLVRAVQVRRARGARRLRQQQ